MRISSGFAKNKKILSPKIPGIMLTQEIARLAIFSMLGERVQDANCVDLYAGSGSLGLEALSRGAASCDFVDINMEATNTIEENFKMHDLMSMKGATFTQDVIKYVSNTQKEYDIVFLDPYYDQSVHKHMFKLLPNIVQTGGVIVFLHGKDLNLESTLEGTKLKIVDERHYGASYVTFLKSQTLE